MIVDIPKPQPVLILAEKKELRVKQIFPFSKQWNAMPKGITRKRKLWTVLLMYIQISKLSRKNDQIIFAQTVATSYPFKLWEICRRQRGFVEMPMASKNLPVILYSPIESVVFCAQPTYWQARGSWRGARRVQVFVRGCCCISIILEAAFVSRFRAIERRHVSSNSPARVWDLEVAGTKVCPSPWYGILPIWPL